MRDSLHDSRRAFFGFGAVAAAATAVAALGSGDPAHAAGGSSNSGEARVDERDERAVDVLECGAVGDGKTDDTAAFTKAIARAAAVRGRVVVPAGDYVIGSVTVPLLVKISGAGADVSRYGAATSGGVNLRHLPSSTAPMLIVDGNGVTLENLGLQANGSKAPLVRVQNGFESRFDRLQLSGVDGTALHIERVNNNLWSDVFVNNCGSRAAAAVVVKSPSEGTNSNTFTCVNLTVEGSPGVAIDLAYGAHPSYFVEFVRFVGLHVEGLQKGAGDDALIRIGNVRQVEFVASIVYGGPGPLIEHRETAGRAIPLMGDIRFLGGSLLGADPARVADSAVLVRLVKGDDFALVGTRLGRFTSCAVEIAPGYGARFLVDPTTRIQTWGTSKAVIDHRADQPEITWSWAGGIAVERSLSLAGHLVGAKGAEGAPVAEALPALGTAGPKPVVAGSDLAGTVAFGVGAGPAAGAQVRITFATAFATAPTVTLTPMSPAAALLPHHVTVTAKHFEIVLAEAIPAKGWLKYGFQVVG